jgi:methylamine dehydrogenase accessory protein MauD
MDLLTLFARLLLAAVFAVAGAAKLADRAGSRRVAADFGLPAALSGPLGVLLPLAELAVAVALIPTASVMWGALGALALLLLFVAGIGANLARGRRPECRCFGQLHSAPAGPRTLARNGALAAVAAFLAWRAWAGEAGPSALGWVGALSFELLLVAAGLLVLGLLIAQWWFLFGLLRQNGRLLARLGAVEESLAAAGLAPAPSENGSEPAYGLPVGTPAPAFTLRDLDGEEVTLASLCAAGRPVLLLFIDPDCGPCEDLLPEVRGWQEGHAGEELTVAPISRGTPEENRPKASEHGLSGVLLQEDWELSSTYQVYGTPSAVLVGPDGTIRSLVAEGAEEVEDLASRAASEEVLPSKIGEPAPEVKLRGLSGREVSLAEFRGEETLVLFWDPGCGFCQDMLADLKSWEQEARPKGAPRLLVVSTGTKEANEGMGISSTVVLDRGFSAGRAFGAAGTPSAVLVDADGRVASEVAEGASAVLDLLARGSGRTAA